MNCCFNSPFVFNHSFPVPALWLIKYSFSSRELFISSLIRTRRKLHACLALAGLQEVFVQRVPARTSLCSMFAPWNIRSMTIFRRPRHLGILLTCSSLVSLFTTQLMMASAPREAFSSAAMLPCLLTCTFEPLDRDFPTTDGCDFQSCYLHIQCMESAYTSSKQKLTDEHYMSGRRLLLQPR